MTHNLTQLITLLLNQLFFFWKTTKAYIYIFQKFEKIYHEQLYKNDVTPKAQFEYAWCLVRSKYPADIQKGIILLEELYKTNEEGQRDYLYYLAIGNARLKEYSKALNYVRSFLTIEPGMYFSDFVISLSLTSWFHIVKKKECLYKMLITQLTFYQNKY